MGTGVNNPAPPKKGKGGNGNGGGPGGNGNGNGGTARAGAAPAAARPPTRGAERARRAWLSSSEGYAPGREIRRGRSRGDGG